MGKFIFLIVFTSLNLLGYFIFTLENKLPNKKTVKVENPTLEDLLADPKKRKVVERVFNKNNKQAKRNPTRKMSSKSFREAIDLDRSKLKKNLGMSDLELDELTRTMENILENSNKATQ